MSTSRHIYEPGNSTRYELVVTRVEGRAFGYGDGTWIAVGPFPDKVRALCFTDDMMLHYTYVMEKMGLREIDASVVCLMLGAITGVEVATIDDEWFKAGIKVPFVPAPL